MGIIFSNGFNISTSGNGGGGLNPTATPTPNPSATPNPTATSAPSPTGTPVPTSTSVPSPTATATSAPSPTPTSAPTGFMTFSEVGSDVVMSVSGTIDLNGLTLVDSNRGPFMGGGIGPTSATFLMGTNGGYGKSYSGFTTTPSNFGTGGGAPPTSTSGDIFGIVTDGTPPYLLIVPTGYTSGTNISSTQTFTGQTFTTLGLTVGTYTYTWSGGSIDIVVSGVPGPTPTPTSTGGGAGVGEWYFYSDEGTINANPPTANGNAIFTINTGTTIETFNPNKASGVTYLYFNVNDSTGTDYTSQFSGYTGGIGTITISQNGDTATYTSTTPDSFMIENLGGGSFFKIDTSKCTQTKESNNSYAFLDPISIVFNSISLTPTPTPGGSTPTPTPTSGGSGNNSWYFYVPFGDSLTMPPLSNGQTVFYNQAGMGPSSVSIPNNNGTTYLMFYKIDSAGTSYETEFSNLMATGGTINVTQNGQTATYTTNQPGVFFLDNAGFFVFNATIQTVTVANPFTYTDPISITFG